MLSIPAPRTLALLGLVGAAACSAPPPTPPESPFIEGLHPEVIVEGRRFTEGPLWDPVRGQLIFSDIPAGELVVWDEARGARVLRTAEGPNGNALDPDGRHVTCLQGGRRIVRWTADEPTPIVERSRDGLLNSPNDLVFGPDGTLWFTDPPWGLENERVGREQPGNFVHRLDPGAPASVPVLTDLATPNGIALSPDGGTLYVSDTGGRPSHPDPAKRDLPPAVHAYTMERGRLADTAPRWSIATRSDGMCVDRSGRLYLSGIKALTVWSPDGAPVAELALERTPSNVCFGGGSGDTLFITAGPTVLRLRVNARAADAPSH